MVTARVVALALLLLTVPATLVIGASGDGDATAGSDAPDAYHEALLLETTGRWAGELAPQGDADWYGVTGSDLSILDAYACLDLEVTGSDALAEVNFTVEGSGNVTLEDTLNPDIDPTLSLASSSFEIGVAGLRPFDANQSTGPYNLSLGLFTLGDRDGDGGTGSDAPAPDANRSPVEVTPSCFGGALTDGDASDTYTFDAANGQEIAFTLAGKGSHALNVTLTDPDGVEQLSASADAASTVFRTPASGGAWTLEVSGPTDKDMPYLVGLSLVDDPEEEEEERNCEPYCFMVG